MDDLSKVCPVCGWEGTKICSACRKVAYCGRSHQKEHWAIHQRVCRPYKVSDDPKVGKFWVAVRDMDPGQTILEESPVIVTPKEEHSSDFYSPSPSSPKKDCPFKSCVTCGLKMDGTIRLCSKCSWPCCKEACEESPRHAYECNLLRTSQITHQTLTSSEISYWLLIIRCLRLEEEQPEAFQDLERLQSGHSISLSQERLLEKLDLVNGFMRTFSKFLHDQTKLDQKIAKDFCDKFINISRINGFEVVLEENDYDNSRVSTHNMLCLYLKASRVNHSCVPNCTWEVGPAPDFKIKIRSCIAIRKGQQLAVSYFVRSHFYGTYPRQKDIRLKGCFICRCPRCMDPTELNTFMSAMVCSVCNDPEGTLKPLVSPNSTGDEDVRIGYLLPINPLDVSPEAMWMCGECKRTRKAGTFMPAVNRILEIIEEKEHALLHSQNYSETKEKKYGRFCLSILRKYQTQFHPNHWILQEAVKGILASMNGPLKLERTLMSVNDLRKFINYSTYLIAIHDKISPGLSLNRCMLLRSSSQALLQMDMKSSLQPGHSSEDNDENNPELLECRKMQEEAYAYFKDSFPAHGESLCVTAQELELEMRAANDPHLRALALEEMRKVGVHL